MSKLIAVALLSLAWVTAFAQERIARVGYLSWQDTGTYYEMTLKGFIEGLREEGFVQGKNLELLRRSASNDPGRFKPLARELVSSGVDVFFAPATPMAAAAWGADRRLPIVIAAIADPVQLEFVKSLARPGTRVTGVTTLNDALTTKRMQILKELVPGLKRVGVVIDEAMRSACSQEFELTVKASDQLGLTLVTAHVDRPDMLDTAFRKLTNAGVQAVVTTLLSTRNNLEQDYAEAALRHRLPSMFELEYAARKGGLMSYGPDFVDIFRRAGNYTGRVLKGGNPAEMAMEQPREFRLVINLNTAKQLGINVPQSILLRANEVIR